ncbi:MAG: hypothetical protein DI598_08935 [Pseudopedobacter saltans]|uniref:Uncharacterized protein n=1 Tax=Pseudopedobacter saltans TaxID=151895 RepID=A0A2W5F557_9SPHI|nr:MAG: hypothetical protein DI598_08935 [Pseudopedobacter saltans]
MIGILLEGGMGGGGGDAGLIGILTFIIACIGLVVGPICLLIALIIYLSSKNAESKSSTYKGFVKVGLGGLVVAGICLLLTAALCDWR